MSQLSTSLPEGTRPVSASAIHYPFVAVVGQRLLKQALVLATIDPHLGGVLIQGPRGIAKTTLSRGLADLLPEESPSQDSPAFVELPLGTTADRLTGSIDLQRVLKHQEVAFTPGLFHKAHGGVLYIDEVNLLDDTLVDLLLDVAAHGVNRVERDGVSHEHATRFVLIGTMNPDEGELRPQLSDRFGLSVTLDSHISIDERLEIVQQRMDFDTDPEGFIARHYASTQQLKERISSARDRLPTQVMSKALQRVIAQRAMEAGVEGVRADIAWRRAALAHAAFEGRKEVTLEDIDTVEPLVLGHRGGTLPPSSPSGHHKSNGGKPTGHDGAHSDSTPGPSSNESSVGNAGPSDTSSTTTADSINTDTRQEHENARSKTQSSLLSSSYKRPSQGRSSQEKSSQTRSSQCRAESSRATSEGSHQRTTSADASHHAIETEQTLDSQQRQASKRADDAAYDEGTSASSSPSAGPLYGHHEEAHLPNESGPQYAPSGIDADDSPLSAGVIQLRNFPPNKYGLIQRNGQPSFAVTPPPSPLRPQGQRQARRRAEASTSVVQTKQIDWFATLSDRRNHTFQANRAKENASASDISIDHFSYRNQSLRTPFMTLVMLDISASTLSRSAIDLAAQAVLRIADESRRLGHQFALLVFGLGGCRWVCRARRVPAELRGYLKQQRVGGGTPLAEALQLGRRFLRQRQQQCKGLESHSWLITDGRTTSVPNIPPWPSTLDIIDTEQGRVRLERANMWAEQLEARCCSLEQFMTSPCATATAQTG